MVYMTVSMNVKVATKMIDEIIKQIKEAMYYIPPEYCGPDKASAYIDGITAGRQQAIDIILGTKKEGRSEERPL